MRKVLLALTVILAMIGLSASPLNKPLERLAAPSVLAASDCIDAVIVCGETADVTYGTCRAQKGSIRYCRKVAAEAYESCLLSKGCGSVLQPSDPTGNCPCGYDFRTGMCKLCDEQSSCDLFDDFGPELEPCLYGSESPIIVDLSGDGFQLTSATDGVWFDITAIGHPSQVAWTTASSDDAFLALDRNSNGRIDNGAELFGNNTAQPWSLNKNGFAALAEFDSNLDGQITAVDSVFGSLRLWQDKNHNGFSEPDELVSLSAAGLSGVSLAYKESRRVDGFGNSFRYRAKVLDVHGHDLGKWAWDVFLVIR